MACFRLLHDDDDEYLLCEEISLHLLERSRSPKLKVNVTTRTNTLLQWRHTVQRFNIVAYPFLSRCYVSILLLTHTHTLINLHLEYITFITHTIANADYMMQHSSCIKIIHDITVQDYMTNSLISKYFAPSRRKVIMLE